MSFTASPSMRHTITLIRSAIRALLGMADDVLEATLRSALSSGDDYASAAKPHVDWDDTAEREALIDSRAKDAFACLGVLDGRPLDTEVSQAATLVATVVGQDLDEGDDGVFRIARKVAPDRVISTVDPEARHGHKTAARGFDGYKGHVSVDPDSEIIVETVVSAGNVGDASAAAELLGECLPEASAAEVAAATDTNETSSDEVVTTDGSTASENTAATPESPADDAVITDDVGTDDADETTDADEAAATPSNGYGAPRRLAVYGDAAYGAGGLLKLLEAAGVDVMVKVQPPVNRNSLFAKDRFFVDLEALTVTCPNGITVDLRRAAVGGGTASFAGACASCPLVAHCTTAAGGRTISVGPHEAELVRARTRQADPAWVADYRATRPKVERKLGHLMRRKHGGRRARVRGRTKVAADFALLAAAANLARLGALGLHSVPGGGWAVAG